MVFSFNRVILFLLVLSSVYSLISFWIFKFLLCFLLFCFLLNKFKPSIYKASVSTVCCGKISSIVECASINCSKCLFFFFFAFSPFFIFTITKIADIILNQKSSSFLRFRFTVEKCLAFSFRFYGKVIALCEYTEKPFSSSIGIAAHKHT